MKPHALGISATFALVAGLAGFNAFAQEAPATRDFDAEIEAALQSAKSAAGFEFLGTLTRNCLLPASRAANTTNYSPRYVSDPATIPAREVLVDPLGEATAVRSREHGLPLQRIFNTFHGEFVPLPLEQPPAEVATHPCHAVSLIRLQLT